MDLASYGIGFFLSILLTLVAYFLVAEPIFPKWVIASLITGLGIFQALVQLVLFLHLGREAKPRWNLLVFLFMFLVLCIVVFGSLWIMYELNYRMN